MNKRYYRVAQMADGLIEVQIKEKMFAPWKCYTVFNDMQLSEALSVMKELKEKEMRDPEKIARSRKVVKVWE